MRMPVPRGIRRLTDVDAVPGQPLFFSWILLFCVLPVDWSRLTLLEIDDGRGFVEQSPMGSMRTWRHEPRFAAPLVGWFVRRFFAHRHAVLRKHLGA